MAVVVCVGCCFSSRGVDLVWGLPAQRSMRPLVVVVVAELIELALEFFNRVSVGLSAEPFFESLLETLNFSLGLRVVRAPVSLPDSKDCEVTFEGIGSSEEMSGEH